MAPRKRSDQPETANAKQDITAKEKPKANSKALSRSTQWRHKRGGRTLQDKAESQQYLTPGEEDAVKDILKRSSNSQPPPTSAGIKKPNKNWPRHFLNRHRDLVSRNCEIIDSRRHENIYEKVAQWFTVIGEVLRDPAIRAENVYNVDETGTLLNDPRSVKVIVNRHDRRNYKPARIRRTLVTSIECISADGRSLPPLIIWPAATQRSNWTTFPTPGWHYACSPSGYNNSEIMLDWLRKVFDPFTKARAGGRPRVLINDGFTAHESAEVLKFCSENNIILCRLPSHTSHILQPLDVAVFGSLKNAYREEVEKLLRGGSNTVGKEHFPVLYSKSRVKAIKESNIKSGWSKTGLFPLNPGKVLRDVKPDNDANPPESNDTTAGSPTDDTLQIPVTPNSFTLLGRKIDEDISTLDNSSKVHVKKLFRAAQRATSKGVLLHIEFERLRKQNDEKKVRKSARSTTVGNGRVMRYEEIMEEQKKRDAKANRVRPGRKRPNPMPDTSRNKRSCISEERERAEREIESWGMENCCAIMRFNLFLAL